MYRDNNTHLSRHNQFILGCSKLPTGPNNNSLGQNTLLFPVGSQPIPGHSTQSFSHTRSHSLNIPYSSLLPAFLSAVSSFQGAFFFSLYIGKLLLLFWGLAKMSDLLRIYPCLLKAPQLPWSAAQTCNSEN